jgi:AcrR family transcriptional regulator
MATASGSAPSRPGRPRSEHSRRAILNAAAELLLAGGLAGTSIESIARLAGTSKATIYRWWTSKELLAVEVLLREWELGPAADPHTGSLSGDLRTLILPWVQRLGMRPYGHLIAGLVARAQGDDVFADQYRRLFVERRREQARAALGRAVKRGEAAPDVDVEAALDLLYGPIYHRLLHRHAQLDEAFAEQVVAAVVGFAGMDRTSP